MVHITIEYFFWGVVKFVDVPYHSPFSFTMARPPKITQAEKDSGHYLSNKEMLAEWLLSKEQGAVTEKLALGFQLLAQRAARQYASKNPNWFDDNVQNALLRMLLMWDKFDPERSENVFAYFTQVAKMEYFRLYNTNKAYVNVDLLIVTGEYIDKRNNGN